MIKLSKWLGLGLMGLLWTGSTAPAPQSEPITERWSMSFGKAFVLSAGRYCLHPPEGYVTFREGEVVATGQPQCVSQLREFAAVWEDQFHLDMVTLEGSPERLARFQRFVENHHTTDQVQTVTDTSHCTCLVLYGTHAASLGKVYHKSHTNVAKGTSATRKAKRLDLDTPIRERDPNPSGLIWQWQQSSSPDNTAPAM